MSKERSVLQLRALIFPYDKVAFNKHADCQLKFNVSVCKR